MKEGLIKDVYEAIAREVQLFLALAYLLMIGIGMLFNYQKYAEFGINIFQYADVFDFLIAPFEDWKIVVFTLGSFMIPVILFYLDRLWTRKFPKVYSKFSFGMDKLSWYKGSVYLAFSLLLIYYVLMAADKYGSIARDEILNSKPIKITYADGTLIDGKQIGRTGDITFLLTDNAVRAIPTASLVKEIEF